MLEQPQLVHVNGGDISNFALYSVPRGVSGDGIDHRVTLKLQGHTVKMSSDSAREIAAYLSHLADIADGTTEIEPLTFPHR